MNIFKYGMKYRPYSIACQPMDGLKEVKQDNTGTYYNILVYDRELTPDEIASYQLTDMQPKPDLKKALLELFKSLQKPLLKDIDNYTRTLAQENNKSLNLYALISEYTRTANNTDLLEIINELKTDNTITCLPDYYELIDVMFLELLEA